MEKLFLLLMVVAIGVTHLQAQQAKQATLLIKKTADWCPFCGTYGWTFFKRVQEETAGKPVIMIANHYSGGLSNINAVELNANYFGPGQPVFFNNGVDMFVGGSNVEAKVKEFVDSVKKAEAIVPSFDVQLKISLTGTSYSASVTTQNARALSGSDYTLSLFTLRNNLIANQTSVGPNASHINVMDKSITTTFGSAIYSGTIAANTKRTTNFTLGALSLHNGKAADVKIAAILWKKEANGQYTFINGTVSSLADLTTSVSELAGNLINVFQKGSNLVVEASGLASNATFDVVDIQGRTVMAKQAINQSQTLVDVSHLQTGVYIVSVSSDKKVAAKKVYITQ